MLFAGECGITTEKVGHIACILKNFHEEVISQLQSWKCKGASGVFLKRSARQ